MNKMTEEQLRDAIKADSNNAELYYELAKVIYEVKMEDGNPQNAHEASEELMKAIVIDPFNGKYHFFRAEVSAHVSSDDWDSELERCIRLKYKVAECRKILKTRDQVWKSSFDMEDYINKMKEKVKEEPSAQNYYELGLHFRRDGAEAFGYFNKALEADPKHAAAMASIAFYYQDRKKNNKAEEWFLKSIEHAPDEEIKSTYYNWTAALYEEIGNDRAAFDIRLKAWNEIGGDYQDLALLGESYLKMNRFEEAEKTLLEVIKDDLKDGNYHGTYCNLVVLYVTLQKFDKAMFYCEKGLKMYPDSANFHHYHSMFSMMSGDIESAKRSLNIALVHEIEYYPAYMLLGSYALKEKDFETALKNYKMVLKYNDDILPVHEALLLIYNHLGNETKAEFHRKKIQDLEIKELLG